MLMAIVNIANRLFLVCFLFVSYTQYQPANMGGINRGQLPKATDLASTAARGVSAAQARS